MKIEVTLDNYTQLMKTLDPTVVKKATRSAITRTSSKLQTQISKATRKRYNIKAKSLSKKSDKVNIHLQKTPNGILLKYSGKRLSPFDFGATVRKAKLNKANYLYNSVSMKILKSGTKRKISGEYGHGGFNPISRKGPSPYKGVVFERMFKKTIHRDMAKGKTQQGRWTSLPVRKVTTPAAPQLVGHEEVRKDVQVDLKGELDRQFKSNLNYYIRKAAGMV